VARLIEFAWNVYCGNVTELGGWLLVGRWSRVAEIVRNSMKEIKEESTLLKEREPGRAADVIWLASAYIYIYIYISVSEGTFKKGANNYMLLAKVISVACALSAAGFAIWSARIPVPDLLNTPMSGPGSITDIMNQQSRLSTIASFFAVVSAIAGVFA
jgi:hypothetical protein